MSGYGDHGGIEVVLESRIEVHVTVPDAVPIGNGLAQVTSDLADRQIGATGRLEAADVAFADRADPDDEDPELPSSHTQSDSPAVDESIALSRQLMSSKSIGRPVS